MASNMCGRQTGPFEDAGIKKRAEERTKSFICTYIYGAIYRSSKNTSVTVPFLHFHAAVCTRRSRKRCQWRFHAEQRLHSSTSNSVLDGTALAGWNYHLAPSNLLLGVLLSCTPPDGLDMARASAEPRLVVVFIGICLWEPVQSAD